jgi:hypothetical protein
MELYEVWFTLKDSGKTQVVSRSQPQDLIAFSAGIGGAAVAQRLGPLKRAVAGCPDEGAMKLEVRSSDGGLGELILRQVEATKNNPQ